jgi:arsenate reductase
MAEAFLKKYASDRFEVLSAGLDPVGINPLTTRVMNEIGIDITGQTSKGLRQFLANKAVHFAIFVCDRMEEKCPTLWPWTFKPLSWPFEDPAACQGSEEQRLARFREVRDQIDEKIKEWLMEPMDLPT